MLKDVLKKARKDAGLTQSELADKIGVSQGAIANWESGTRRPDFGTLAMIAAALKSSPQKLFAEHIKTFYEQNPNASEEDFFNDIDEIPDSITNMLIESSSRYPMPPNAKQMEIPKEAAYLPYRGRIHAGDPIEADGIEEVREVPTCVAKAHPNGFLLDVVGDCMNNIYCEGTLVLVDPTLQPQSNDIGAFMLNGEVVMRRVFVGANLIVLTPDSTNEEHKDIVVTGEDELVTYGRIVWYQSSHQL